MRTAILLVLAACAGRSGDAPHPDAGPRCAARSGAYDVRAEKLDGNCPADPVTFGVLEASGEVPRSCRGSATASDDACTMHVKMSCPPALAAEPAPTANVSGSVRWDADAFEASGTVVLQEQDADGALVCSSSFRLTYRRR